MKHHVTYKPIFPLIFIISLIPLNACGKKDPLENIYTHKLDLSNPPLEITILDTGKSDCILIETDNKTVMIDTGLDKNGDQILEVLDKKGISKIDYMILTHLDKDHIGGADIILDNVTVTQVIQPNYIKDTKQYDEYIQALQNNSITPLLLTQDLNLTLDDTSVTLYAPKKSEYEQSNDYSIITSLIFKNQGFLFVGDSEEERLSEFLASNPPTYTFLKLPHHGEYSSTLSSFISQIQPTYAAITCSEEQAPDIETLQLLNDYDTQTFLSSDGTITIKSDGENINLSQQLTLSTPVKASYFFPQN